MPILEARDVRKIYGAVVAVDNVSFAVEPGSVHALLGENGAGKSTLVKIMSGAVQPTEGTLLLDGKPVRYSSTAEAARRGVAIVSQELNLFPDLNVVANLFPKREVLRGGMLLDRKAMIRAADPVMAQLGLSVGYRTEVGHLPLAQRQLLEIARALLTDPRVLILDEPTSALDRSSTDRLLNILKVLRERNVGVVFVSHILEDVMALSDVMTVLRDGRTVFTSQPTAEMTMDTLVQAMLGDKATRLIRPDAARAPGAVVPGADGVPAADGTSGTASVPSVPSTLSAPSGGSRPALRLVRVSVDKLLRDTSLNVASGEIVGLAGLASAGQATVLELVAGLRRASSGEIMLPSGKLVPHGLPKCIAAGVALVSGDRRRVGLMLDKPIWENMAQVRTVALGRDGILISRAAVRERAKGHAQRLGLRYNSLDQRAALLSGGNQQKLVFAKWLDVNPTVLLLDDPTRGVDVGAKTEMHALIRSVAAAGAAVVLCSTDLDELALICERVSVFVQGQVTTTLTGDARTEHNILQAMNSVSPEPSTRS